MKSSREFSISAFIFTGLILVTPVLADESAESAGSAISLNEDSVKDSAQQTEYSEQAHHIIVTNELWCPRVLSITSEGKKREIDKSYQVVCGDALNDESGNSEASQPKDVNQAHFRSDEDWTGSDASSQPTLKFYNVELDHDGTTGSATIDEESEAKHESSGHGDYNKKS